MSQFAKLESSVPKPPRFKPFPIRDTHPVNLTEARDEWYIDVAKNLNAAERDVLVALMRAGPLDDGDVPCKSGRDGLLDLGLASKIVVSGRAMPQVCRRYVKPPELLPRDEHIKGYSDGFQAATYRGRAVYDALLDLDIIKP